MPLLCQLKVARRSVEEEEEEFTAPQDIEVPQDKPTVLGRSPITGIIDKKLSRHQVEVTADYARKILKVKQLGSNPGSYNKNVLEKGSTAELSEGDTLELLEGKYKYKVCFGKSSQSSEVSSSVKVKNAKEIRSDSSAKIGELGEGGKHHGNEKPAKSAQKRNLEEEDDSDGMREAKRTSPISKKMRKEHDGKGDEDEDDIDRKLAALQKKAEDKEQKKAKTPTKQTWSFSNSHGRGDASPGTSQDDANGGPAPAGESGKPSTEEEWKEDGQLLVYKTVGVKAGSKVVGFDMDGTLITTASGKVFAQNADDWKIIYSEVRGKLKKLHDEGYKIIIFTNQLGISKGKLTVKDFRRKLCNVQKKLGVPLQAFAAMSGGIYRKPAMGMWEYMQSKGNDGIKIDMKASMYVGDAAGRPKDWAPKKKKDFSISDRLFALNLGLPFKTPEEFFLGQKPAKFDMPAFDPRSITPGGPLLIPPGTALPAKVQEVLLLVGYPASGKSTFVKQHLLQHKYVHVNRDTIGSWQKCVAACSAALSKGQSVVIDNTNGDLDSRKRYTDCAKKAKVQCRCFTFTTTIDHARHNEKFRQLTPSGKKHDSIADVIFFTFRKNFVAPKKEEGFVEVAQVNFVPSFQDKKEEKLYHTFLLEK